MNTSLQTVAASDAELAILDSLNNYLIKAAVGFDKILQISRFSGGYSNLTYLLQTENNEYVLRRPPLGANIKSTL